MYQTTSVLCDRESPRNPGPQGYEKKKDAAGSFESMMFQSSRLVGYFGSRHGIIG